MNMSDFSLLDNMKVVGNICLLSYNRVSPDSKIFFQIPEIEFT